MTKKDKNGKVSVSITVRIEQPYLLQDTLKFSDLNGDYLGQTPPGDIPVVFAPGIVSSDFLAYTAPACLRNGNPTSLESFQQPFRKAYEGKCLLIIKFNYSAGRVTVMAESEGLKSNKIIINVQK